MVSAALFPPTLLTAVSNGQVYERVLLELVAGLCTYLLLRRLVLRRSASMAGAIAFALNGTFAWFGHVPIDAVATNVGAHAGGQAGATHLAAPALSQLVLPYVSDRFSRSATRSSS